MEHLTEEIAPPKDQPIQSTQPSDSSEKKRLKKQYKPFIPPSKKLAQSMEVLEAALKDSND